MGSRYSDCVIRDKLKNVKGTLKKRCNENYKKLIEEMEIDKDEAKRWEIEADSTSLEEDKRLKWMEARKKWLEAERKKLEMASQKAQIKWVEEGDENTKFFHAIIRKRERKNGIQGLNINAVWTEDPESIKDVVYDFFKKKFAAQKKAEPKLRSDKIKKLAPEDVESLERPFTEEEIWEAIKRCGKNKAPGPDGITFTFVKRF